MLVNGHCQWITTLHYAFQDDNNLVKSHFSSSSSLYLQSRRFSFTSTTESVLPEHFNISLGAHNFSVSDISGLSISPPVLPIFKTFITLVLSKVTATAFCCVSPPATSTVFHWPGRLRETAPPLHVAGVLPDADQHIHFSTTKYNTT